MVIALVLMFLGSSSKDHWVVFLRSLQIIVVQVMVSIPVPSNIANADNINFVAFLVGEDNIAINARASHANENQEFEENP